MIFEIEGEAALPRSRGGDRSPSSCERTRHRARDRRRRGDRAANRSGSKANGTVALPARGAGDAVRAHAQEQASPAAQRRRSARAPGRALRAARRAVPRGCDIVDRIRSRAGRCASHSELEARARRERRRRERRSPMRTLDRRAWRAQLSDPYRRGTARARRARCSRRVLAAPRAVIVTNPASRRTGSRRCATRLAAARHRRRDAARPRRRERTRAGRRCTTC